MLDQKSLSALNQARNSIPKPDHIEKVKYFLKTYKRDENIYMASEMECDQECLNHVYEFLDKNRRSNKTMSKKLAAELARQIFIIDWQKKSSYLVAEATWDKSKRGISLCYTKIGYMKTPWGTIYFFGAPYEKKRFYKLLPSHVFDRYNQRVYDDDLDRAQAIAQFSHESMNYPEQIVENCIYEKTETGMTLGELYKTDDAVIMLYNTFITKDMMGKEQQKIYDSIPTIDIAMSKKMKEFSSKHMQSKFDDCATPISEGI